MTTGQSKPILKIWETKSLGLIISYPSGIIISNQTGGFTTIQSQMEGVYVPLRMEAPEMQQYFAGHPWNGQCDNGIDIQTADFIDTYLTRIDHGMLDFIRVDRERLKESHEAWINVIVQEPTTEAKMSLVSGFGQSLGVLTWQNSD